ncbi:hypothetical protein HDV00_007437 [Rhizophlyctis rosea]|nr:hypothetical protein HDV00_007437 [Rhizophlyctis rosea]
MGAVFSWIWDERWSCTEMQLMQGMGVEKYVAVAVEWYLKAAEGRDVDSQFRSGCCYKKGIGLEQDLSKAANLYRKALEWYERSAMGGHIDGQYNMGRAYEIDKGIDVDLAATFHWYEKPASQGHAFAQYESGRSYEFGKGTDASLAAVMWYQRAADRDKQALKRD